MNTCIACNVETKNPKFCSCSCAAIFNNKKYIKRKRKIYESICSLCNAKCFGEKNRKKCDDCKYKGTTNFVDWAKITIGDLRKKLDLYQFHARTRMLARRIYKNRTCCNCGYTKHVQVCHIKPVSAFGEESTIADINNIENLIGLCPNCHWEFDHGFLKISELGIAPRIPTYEDGPRTIPSESLS